jgi:hypothetical protein
MAATRARSRGWSMPVYADLRQIAGRRMADRFDRPLDALTLQPTAIANDAVMELRRQRARWQNT